MATFRIETKQTGDRLYSEILAASADAQPGAIIQVAPDFSLKPAPHTLAWDPLVIYPPGAICFDRGGIWQAVDLNLNSRPISGNADWTLVGGIPFVDVILTPVDLTTAPFYDPTSTGPGVVAIPGTPGMVFVIPQAATWAGPGDAWGTSATPNLGLVSAASGLTPLYVTFVDDNLASDFSGSEPWVVKAFGAEESSGPGSIGADLVIWGTNDVTSGGIGTRSLTVRVYYSLIPGNQPATTPNYFSITAVSQGAKTITVTDAGAALDGATGTFTVVGSTGNNGTYHIVSAVAGEGSTVITVSESIPNSTADGWVKR